MLVISQAQFAEMDKLQFDQFVYRLDQFLRNHDLVGEPDPTDPLGATDRLVANAHTLGLTSELGIARYALLATQFGDSLEAIRDRPWFSVLSPQGAEPRDPDWINRVFTTVVGNFEVPPEYETDEEN